MLDIISKNVGQSIVYIESKEDRKITLWRTAKQRYRLKKKKKEEQKKEEQKMEEISKKFHCSVCKYKRFSTAKRMNHEHKHENA